MSAAKAWQLTRGALLGLALFGLVSHALLLLGLPVATAWMPACIALGVGCVFRFTQAPAFPATDPPPRWIPIAALAILGVVLAAVAYGAIATPARQWDGAASWSVHARILADSPTLAQPYFTDDVVYAHSREYPLLQPLCLASAMRLCGASTGRILFPALYVLLVSLFGLTLRRLGTSSRATWVLVAAFALTPMLVAPTSGGVDSGFGELFLLLCLTTLAAGLATRDTLLIAVGAFTMPLVKPEGIFYAPLAALVPWTLGDRRQLGAILGGWILAISIGAPLYARLSGNSAVPWIATALAVSAAAIGSASWIARRTARPWLWKVLIPVAGGAAVIAGLVLLQDRIGQRDVVAVYLGGFDRAADKLFALPQILVGYAAELCRVRKFGLLFPLLALLALAPRRLSGPCPSPALALLVAVGGASLVVPFLLSPETDVALHLRSSMDRLILQWTGTAWLLTGLWWTRALARDPWPGS